MIGHREFECQACGGRLRASWRSGADAGALPRVQPGVGQGGGQSPASGRVSGGAGRVVSGRHGDGPGRFASRHGAGLYLDAGEVGAIQAGFPSERVAVFRRGDGYRLPASEAARLWGLGATGGSEERFVTREAGRPAP